MASSAKRGSVSDDNQAAAGRPPPDTPVSVDGVEIALDEEKDDPAQDSTARVLLTKQASLVDADLRFRELQCQSERIRFNNERVSLLLRQLTVLVGTCFALGVGAILFSAFGARGVVVEAFDTPPALASSGISGQSIASRIQDELATIQDRTRTTATKQQIQNAWTNEVTVQVPQTGMSISEISRTLRRSLGDETYVSGSMFLNPDQSVSLVVRGTGIAPRSFRGPRDQLDRLITSASEYLFGSFEPRLFSTYLRQTGRMAEVEAFTRAAMTRASQPVRSQLLLSLSIALTQLGRQPEAAYYARQAVELDRTNWAAWNNLVSATRRVEGYEAAWRVGQELAAVPGSAGADAEPAWYNHRRIVQDWEGQIRLVDANARSTAGVGSMTVLASTLLADAEAHRHDWAAARRHLAAANPSDPALPATRLYLLGLWLLENGRAQEAVAPLERFHALWRASRPIALQFEFGHCEVGLAYALAGRSAEAEAIFESGRDFPQCLAFAADGIEATGNHVAAERAYRRAAALAPNVPFAYHRWGLALLRRGEPRRAEALFAKASRQGPRWADPLKGLGDALAGQGRWQEAAASYRAALNLAPGWRELRAAAGQANQRLAAQ
jgi:tetratricopeptide (TPR) repeat protein